MAKFLRGFLKMLIDMINLLLLITVLALAGVFLVAWWIFRKICLLIFLIIAGIINGIYRMILGVIERILAVVAIICIVVGGMYLFLEKNPAIKSQLMGILYNVERLTGQLANLPFLGDVNRFFSFTNRLQGQASANPLSLLQAFGGQAIPRELAPMLGMLQSPEMISSYGKLLEGGQLGQKGEGAIPLLAQALRSPDDKMRGAAFQSLGMINTPEAKNVIQQYMRMIQQAGKQGASAVQNIGKAP